MPQITVSRAVAATLPGESSDLRPPTVTRSFSVTKQSDQPENGLESCRRRFVGLWVGPSIWLHSLVRPKSHTLIPTKR